MGPKIKKVHLTPTTPLWGNGLLSV